LLADIVPKSIALFKELQNSPSYTLLRVILIRKQVWSIVAVILRDKAEEHV
jgi:hypothetical protein